MLQEILSSRTGTDILVDEEQLPIRADDEGLAHGEEAHAEDAVRLRDRLAGVAQDRVGQLEFLGELSIRLGLIDTGGK